MFFSFLLPQFQAAIVLSIYGSSLNGPPKAIGRCGTIQELDNEVDAPIKCLERARNIAKGILEENEGEFELHCAAPPTRTADNASSQRLLRVIAI